MTPKHAVPLAALLATFALSGQARADVRHDGTWPKDEKAVTLDVTQTPRADAVKKLADAAGWSVVMSAPVGANDIIDVHVKGQPPSKVLDILLANGSYVAKRDGTLVSIAALSGDDAKRADAVAQDADAAKMAEDAKKIAAGALSVAASAMASAASPASPASPTSPASPASPASPVSPVPPVLPVPPTENHHGKHKHHGGNDRIITGEHVTIGKDEVVGDLTVLGGSVDVEGQVDGDLCVLGGQAEVHDGAHVSGDAVTLGGSLSVDDGASVDGDAVVIGGVLNRSDKAHFGGTARDSKGEISVSVDTDDDDHEEKSAKPESHGHKIGAWLGSMMAQESFLFVFGAFLLALFTPRMDLLKAEVAARPMRSLALGVLGAIAALITLLVLCVTIIGIPLAILEVCLVPVGVLCSLTAVLTTVGQALFGHKTKNPYVHLAAGCGILLLIGAIPKVGTIVWIGVILLSIGTLVATRLAGLVPVRGPRSSDPYRTQASP